MHDYKEINKLKVVFVSNTLSVINAVSTEVLTSFTKFRLVNAKRLVGISNRLCILDLLTRNRELLADKDYW